MNKKNSISRLVCKCPPAEEKVGQIPLVYQFSPPFERHCRRSSGCRNCEIDAYTPSVTGSIATRDRLRCRYSHPAKVYLASVITSWNSLNRNGCQVLFFFEANRAQQHACPMTTLTGCEQRTLPKRGTRQSSRHEWLDSKRGVSCFPSSWRICVPSGVQLGVISRPE